MYRCRVSPDSSTIPKWVASSEQSYLHTCRCHNCLMSNVYKITLCHCTATISIVEHDRRCHVQLSMQVCSTSSEGPIGGLPTPSIISVNSEGQFELCNGVQLHMFISQPPCGDACVIDSNLQPASRLPRPESSAHAADMQQNQLPQKDIDSSGEGSSGTRVSQTRDNSWHTTHTSSDGQGLPSGPLFTRMHLTASESSAPPTLRGPGWLVEDSQGCQSGLQQADDMLRGECRGARQGLGHLCRKPGRGDTTLSMSCSDKLARWTLLGVQVCCCELCMCCDDVVVCRGALPRSCLSLIVNSTYLMTLLALDWCSPSSSSASSSLFCVNGLPEFELQDGCYIMVHKRVTL